MLHGPNYFTSHINVSKVNMTGQLGCPGLAGGGEVFPNHRGFVKGYFPISLGICTAFESELQAAMYS